MTRQIRLVLLVQHQSSMSKRHAVTSMMDIQEAAVRFGQANGVADAGLCCDLPRRRHERQAQAMAWHQPSGPSPERETAAVVFHGCTHLMHAHMSLTYGKDIKLP